MTTGNFKVVDSSAPESQWQNTLLCLSVNKMLVDQAIWGQALNKSFQTFPAATFFYLPIRVTHLFSTESKHFPTL